MKIMLVCTEKTFNERINYLINHFRLKRHKNIFLSSSSYKFSSARRVGLPTFTRLPASLFNIFIFLVALPLCIVIWKPDIVVASLPPGEISISTYLICKILGKKIVFDIRDEWEESYILEARLSSIIFRFVKRLMSILYRNVEAVVTVTPPLAATLRRRGVKEIHTIPNGADITVFRPITLPERAQIRKRLGLEENDFMIIYTGKMTEPYMFHSVINTLKLLWRRNDLEVKMVLLGSGGETLQRLVSSTEIRENILFLGFKQDRQQVADIIASADVGLIPFNENRLWNSALPAKFYEYCACGLPVIACVHEDSVLANLIREHEIGYATYPSDFKGLAKIIVELRNNEDFRKLAGKRGRKLVTNHFDRTHLADKFLKLLDSIVKT